MFAFTLIWFDEIHTGRIVFAFIIQTVVNVYFAPVARKSRRANTTVTKMEILTWIRIIIITNNFWNKKFSKSRTWIFLPLTAYTRRHFCMDCRNKHRSCIRTTCHENQAGNYIQIQWPSSSDKLHYSCTEREHKDCISIIFLSSPDLKYKNRIWK